MKDSEEKRIQNQFGGFCTRVLKNEANRIHNGYSRQREWEEPLDHMGPEELSQLAAEDRYFQDDHIFEVLGVPVVVTGDVLAEILAQLPEGKRDIILLSFFLEMTDREIAEYLHIVHQTVSKRRIGILKELRKTLEKEEYECVLLCRRMPPKLSSISKLQKAVEAHRNTLCPHSNYQGCPPFRL